MNRNIVLLVIIASSVFAGNTFCADWKYYGEVTTASEIKEILFYDAVSIKNTNNSIKLWVKVVDYSNIENGVGNKLVIDRASKKISTGYTPPIAGINPKVTNAAYLEEAASESSVKSKAEILYQITCKDKKYRKISGASFRKDGTPDQRFGITKWEDIAPGSNAENLAKIVCESNF